MIDYIPYQESVNLTGDHIGYTVEKEVDMRFLVRYRFVGNPELVGIYRTAKSVEEAFNAEKKMWKCWGREIEFVEGFRVK